MSADSVNETSKSTHGKGKPKVGAITVDSTTAQQISQLQGAVKGLTNWMKGVQLNTNPTQSSQNSTTGTDQPTSYNPNSTPSFRGKGGRGRGRGRGGSDLGQVKSCAIGVKILFLKRKLVTK